MEIVRFYSPKIMISLVTILINIGIWQKNTNAEGFMWFMIWCVLTCILFANR